MASAGYNPRDNPFIKFRLTRNLRATAQTGLGVAIVVALAVMLSWPLQLRAIISPHNTIMVFNTALSLLLTAAGLLLVYRGYWRWGLAAGLLSGALGFATFSQYLTGTDLGLDQLFIRDNLSPAPAPSGRMAPNTSLSFGLSGLALTLAALTQLLPRPAPIKLCVTLLGAIILGMGLMALVGHLTGLVSAYGWTSHAHMAPHTASGFVIIGFALIVLFSPPPHPLKAFQQWQLSWSVPAIILIGLYTLVILNIEQERNAEKSLGNKADSLAATIFNRLGEIEAAQQRMVQRLNNQDLSTREWRDDAYAFLRDMPSLVAIAQVDAQGKLLALESRKREPMPWPQLLAEAVQHPTGMYQQLDDGQLARFAKLSDGQSAWLVNLISLKKLADSLTRLESDRDYQLQIQLNSAPPQALLSPEAEDLSALRLERSYPHGSETWHLQLTATRDFLASFRSPLQGIIMSLVALLGLSALVLQRLYFNVAHKERELDEAYQRQRSAMDAMIDGVIVINNRGLILSINRAAQEMFGYGPEELINCNVGCLMPEPYRSAHNDYLAHYRQTGEKRIIGDRRMLRAQKRDGTEFPMLLQITESSTATDQLFTGVIHDLSEKMAAQALLSEKEAVLTAAVKTSPVGFSLADVQGCVIEVNQAMADWFGYSPDEMIGMETIELVADEERASSLEDFAKLCSGELDSLMRQKQYKRKNGDYVWGQLSASAIKNQDQRIIFIAIQILDIHQSKTMALLLEERNRALERSNTELDQFAYVASHDLKAPLNAIEKLASWIEEDCGDLLPDASKPHLQLLKGRAQRMSKLLDDLLMYSRVGRVAQDISDINLRNLARDIFEFQDVGDNFKLEAPDLQVQLPRTPLELVLRNLIANAIKHHHRNTGVIHISCTPDAKGYALKVSDDGPGIPPHLHNKAMQMFQTLRPRDEREGSGMGLALCKKIIDFYQGNIRIESDGSQGTSIYLYWPKVITATPTAGK